MRETPKQQRSEVIVAPRQSEAPDDTRKPIKLEEMFSRCNDRPKRVLVEGERGVGKTSLCRYILKEGKTLYSDYKYIMTFELRDPNVQAANSVSELLEQSPIGRISEEVLGSGNGVLIVLDGWDELPDSQRQDEHGPGVFHRLLKGRLLKDCSIVVTSRPSASEDIRPRFTLLIEIMGFESKGDLKKFFSNYFKCSHHDFSEAEADEKAENLLQKINNPVIESFCYRPLNASILAYLYDIEERGEFPDTQYDIMTELVSHCIHRYRHRKRDQLDTGSRAWFSLDELPSYIAGHFQKLCKLAYVGIMNDKVVFRNSDDDFLDKNFNNKDFLDENFKTLGLLQDSRPSTHRTTSTQKKLTTFYFHHLSIQELLAAIHIANLEEKREPLDQLLGKPARFVAVFQFFAATTKLMDCGNLFRGIVLKVMNHPQKQRLLLCLIHSLYEAQHSKSPRSSEPSEVTALYKIVVDKLGSTLDLRWTTLNPTDCYSLGDFLTHCKDFDVNLDGCFIGAEGCKALFGQGRRWNIKILRYVSWYCHRK